MSEIIAAKRFISLGFSVEIGHGIGPDLYCELGEWRLRVEVKTASKGTGSWRCGRVYPDRRNDDLVAIVMPNDYVYIDSMENHMFNSSKDGSRTITKIVKEFGLHAIQPT